MSRLLVVDHEPPQPTRDGAGLRMARLLGIAREAGWDVTFAALRAWPTGMSDAPLREAGIEAVARDGDVAGHLEAGGARYDAVLLSRIHTAEPLTPVVRRCAPRARLVFDTMDLHHVQVFRMAKQQRSGALLRRSVAIKAAELAAVREADATLVVTEHERGVLAAEVPDAQLEVVSVVHPLGPAGPSFAARRGGVFVGFYGHLPNAEAARALVDDVWPRVVARDPAIGLTLVGALLPEELAARSEPWLDPAGHVPALVPVLDAARVAVVPLPSGAGVKTKVLEAMAHGLPVVGSAVALEGVPFTDGEDALLADGPEATAAAVLRVHEDRELWERLAAGGRRIVAERFSAAHARDGLLAALGAPVPEAVGG